LKGQSIGPLLYFRSLQK